MFENEISCLFNAVTLKIVLGNLLRSLGVNPIVISKPILELPL